MKTSLATIADRTILYSFYLLFFLVPLILTPFNYELFEYNKMMLTYGLTIVITGAWIIKMIYQKKIITVRTPLDIPLLLFIISQFLSTIFSIDRHVSIWGYYSRFNGGLLSTISYTLLYYAFVSNFPKKKILNLLSISLTSGMLVSLYGILEHFGIDKDIWVQDVQNRIFSTLGQPNWLAAYLAVLLPLSIGLTITNIPNLNYFLANKIKRSKVKTPNYNSKLSPFWARVLFGFIPVVFYIALIFTKSRSGFLGFWIGNIVFWFLLLYKYKKSIIKLFLIVNFSLLTFNFIFGTPFSQLNRFTLFNLLQPQTNNKNQSSIPQTSDSIISVGITESGTIRKIVWKGAIDIFKNFPLFGSGTETFAFSYYLFRPREHNMTSEWDFLYNKAHNEYLNFAATTGVFGLGSYSLIIIAFVVWFLKIIYKSKFQFSSQISKNKSRSGQLQISSINNVVLPALFSAWVSILITNFFGFSVVVVQIFFFLIPAILFKLNHITSSKDVTKDKKSTTNISQTTAIIILTFIIFYLVFMLLRIWYADTLFAQGHHYFQRQEYLNAYENIKKALVFNRSEPVYYDDLALPAAQLGVVAWDKKDSTLSAQLINQAIAASDLALNISPNNVGFWKTRTRLFYILAQTDEKYLNQALDALLNAKLLSPTDPKIRYNLGVIYLNLEKDTKALEELKAATELKPDYRDAFFAKGLYYETQGMKKEAIESFEYILNYIDPNEKEAQEKLKELGR